MLLNNCATSINNNLEQSISNSYSSFDQALSVNKLFYAENKDKNELKVDRELILEALKYEFSDTKELNTFNLAAEAELQNSNLHFRQIISNEESYKEDLNRFNWFLLKDGEQGTMSNNSKLALADLIRESNKFKSFRSWELPDGSQAKLLSLIHI